MIKLYTIGHKLPSGIKQFIPKFDYWNYVVVAKKNKSRDAKEVISKLEDDDNKIMEFETDEIKSGFH